MLLEADRWRHFFAEYGIWLLYFRASEWEQKDLRDVNANNFDIWSWLVMVLSWLLQPGTSGS
jgi:hypothetical protein